MLLSLNFPRDTGRRVLAAVNPPGAASPKRGAMPDRDAAVAMLSVTLDRSAPEPLVRQIHDHVRDLILMGRLPAGARLPSTRKLARDLEVSRTVALDAFAQLTAEGFLEASVG